MGTCSGNKEPEHEKRLSALHGAGRSGLVIAIVARQATGCSLSDMHLPMSVLGSLDIDRLHILKEL